MIEVGWDEVPPRSFSTTDFAMEAIDVEPLGEAPGAIPFRGLQQGRTPDDIPQWGGTAGGGPCGVVIGLAQLRDHRSAVLGNGKSQLLL